MPTILEILHSRRRRGDRADGHRLGLVLPIGGLGGVATAGMVAALYRFGYQNVFDAVYGSSVGALNGCYFLGSNTLISARGYDVISTDPCMGRQMFDLRRILRGQAPFDIDRFFRIMDLENPVDWDAFWRSDTKLRIVATDAETAEPVVLPPFETKEELITSLRASAFIPIASSPNLPYRGKLYVDGGLAAPVPYRLALQDGCTHVLALIPWAADSVTRPAPRLLRTIAYLHPEGRRKYPKIYQRYLSLHLNRAHVLSDLKSISSDIVYPVTVTPQSILPGLVPVSDHSAVYRTLIDNYCHMRSVLGGSEDTLPREFCPDSNPLSAHFSPERPLVPLA